MIELLHFLQQLGSGRHVFHFGTCGNCRKICDSWGGEVKNKYLCGQNTTIMENEMIVYQADTDNVKLDVRIDKETVWLSVSQMAALFEREESNIRRHIINIFKECELVKESNVHFLHVAFSDKPVPFYSLDVIISVGYRVKSQRGIQFRIWATGILKEHLLRGYSIRQELQHLEDKLDRRLTEHAQVLEEHQKKIDFILKTELKPTQGIFFQGQIFDAYVFVENLMREAKREIVLVDNYVDLSVLERLSKKNNGVKVVIYTHPKTSITDVDIKKYNAQYGGLELRHTEAVHDRFIILDGEAVFHLGASLKDLGKKCFAFSRMDKSWARELMAMLKD